MSETYELREPDLDVVTVKCECGNSFDFPRDALFALYDIQCGQCGKSGQMAVIDSKSVEG